MHSGIVILALLELDGRIDLHLIKCSIIVSFGVVIEFQPCCVKVLTIVPILSRSLNAWLFGVVIYFQLNLGY